MKIHEIKHRTSGDVLYKSKAATLAEAVAQAVASGANLSDADLRGADLRGAYLGGAYLGGADLRGANLRGADLGGADLRGADLRGAYLGGADLGCAYLGGADLGGADLRGADLGGAYLGGADLRGAKGFAPERVTDLLMLLDQPGPIRAYKLVAANGDSPIHDTKLNYQIGQYIEVADANSDVTEQCAAGINVATLPWCLREWKPGYRMLVVEFTAADVAAIPTNTDGKFRLHRATVVGEKQIDPVALGLVAAPKEEPCQAGN